MMEAESVMRDFVVFVLVSSGRSDSDSYNGNSRPCTKEIHVTGGQYDLVRDSPSLTREIVDFLTIPKTRRKSTELHEKLL